MYGYDSQFLWETPRDAAQRRYYEDQQAADEARQIALQLARLQMDMQGDQWNNALRIAQQQNDLAHQQEMARDQAIRNQQYQQSLGLDVARMGRQRAEQGEIEVTNPMQRAKRMYGY